MSQPPKNSSAAQSFASSDAAKDSLVESRVNSDEMFTLIDGILPFEACLYYQVLPLSIEGSRLNLGMVSPSDYAAAEYVRRQVSYINYSVVTWEISSDWHRDSLSRYLSHAAKVKQLRHRGKTAQDTASSANPVNYQATLVVDTPEELEQPAETPAPAAPPAPVAPAAAVVSATPAPDKALANPLELIIHPEYQSLPLEALHKLSSKKLMEALLSRILEQGIGRLYFEHHADYGRILWSKDGVVQSALDSLNLEVFQGVISEFKRMTHLPMLRVNKPKQVEIERLYLGERVLMRFRVMPNHQGEDATLQVLRGTALRFYQQQQIENLGRDALGIAQTLQQRLQEIRDRARQTLNFEMARQETLPAIIQMLRQMEMQIQDMMKLAANSENSSVQASENDPDDAADKAPRF